MIRVLIVPVLVPAVVVSLNMPAHTQDNAAEAALATVISDYERILKLADPVTAGLDGDRDALRRLPDPRRETELARSRELAAIGGRLAQIRVSDLSPGSVLNHVLLSRLVSEAVEQVAFDFDRIAFQNDDGFHTLGDYLGRTTTIASRDDADAWLARLDALPELLCPQHREPAARHRDAVHAAEDRGRPGARRRAQAGGHESGGQPAAAALRADAARVSLRPCRPSTAAGRSTLVRDRDRPRAAHLRGVPRAGVRAGRSSLDQLAHDTERRSLVPFPGPPRDDHDA